MLCENCQQREATIHEVLIKGGAKVERHLCEACAQQAGVNAAGSPPISALISKYMMSPKSDPPETPAACPSCGLGYAEFRQSGLLGCPACYDAFETRLGPLIERAHEGGSGHVGKIPRRALSHRQAEGRDVEAILGDARSRAERLESIRKQLADAVECEQYERAARLRDELRRLASISGHASVEGDEGAPAESES